MIRFTSPIRLLLPVAIVTSIYLSCKKKDDNCHDNMCRYTSFYCKDDKCVCSGGFTGRFCDSVELTGHWESKKCVCTIMSTSNTDSAASIDIIKKAGDTTKLLVINIAGTNDTIIADIQSDGMQASFSDYRINYGGHTDTIYGTFYLSYNHTILYNYGVRNGSIITCQRTFTKN